MPILLRNIPLGLEEPEDELLMLAARRLRVPVSAIRNYAIVRRSLDARKEDIRFSYHLEIALDEPLRKERSRLRRIKPGNASWIEPEPIPQLEHGIQELRERPVVVGFGPAGMFAGLRLAQHGYKPIIFERGREVRRRHRDVLKRYFRERDFDPASNLLFGEGGAGTYSDGKVYTRLGDPLCRAVLETLYQHGADPDILINARPHIGSDRLPTICTRIRRKIESLGGEIHFESVIDDIRVDDECLAAIHVRTTGERPTESWMLCGPVIFAIGHSARDTIEMLINRGVRVTPKPFQLGVRIEHPQAMVDRWQYGTLAGHPRLGPAEYNVVASGAASDCGDMFSFCMCPGGMILPAVESPGLIATNGASRSRRSSSFANSGLVITLDPATMGLNPLEALAFQRGWEHLAFQVTDGSYRVPCQRASDYLHERPSDGTLSVSCPLGGQWAEIRTVLPEVVARALDRGLPMLERKFPGFAGPEGLIAGPESRASVPVRILRDRDTRQASRTANLYPAGEGSGYAGGIVTAAVDGMKSADAIIQRYAPTA
ncbi:MAG: hypothetical protein JSU63_21730 [Phycisphaerales bacterium]|nr:MAG: hypothetical protein JSU63_21730 [Phycisphaerales bacterium]